MKDNISKKLRKIFKNAEGIDKLLLFNTSMQDPNFKYLTGFTSGLFEDTVTIADRRSVKVYSSPLEYGDAKRQVMEPVKVVLVNDGKKFKKDLGGELHGKAIGINGNMMPYAIFKRLKKYKPRKIIDVSEAFASARQTKSEYEVRQMRSAALITKKAMAMIQRYLKEGVTELEIASKFDEISMRLGSEKPSFSTIVCFGANAAYPHHAPDKTKLGKGDMVLIDAGATVKNYCSDISRTFIFGKGSRYKEKARIIEVVRETQLKAISAAKAGFGRLDLHNLAKENIDSADNGKYKGKFIHGLGHSLGIEVHDSSTSKKLIDGMVTTIEPGIYVEGLGGARIEDDIFITKKGHIVL